MGDILEYWSKSSSGFCPGSFNLMFLIENTDLSDNLLSNPKLFVDDLSLFFVVHDKDSSLNDFVIFYA